MCIEWKVLCGVWVECVVEGVEGGVCEYDVWRKKKYM